MGVNLHNMLKKKSKAENAIGQLSIEAQRVVGKFSQFPITPAWAITIHKSQGLTTENVEIDLGKGAFVCGQGYVALSRCKSIKGLKLRNPLSMGDVKADPDVLNFYSNIKEQQSLNIQQQLLD